MNITATILLSIIVFCIGVAIGSIIESLIKRRPGPRPVPPPSSNSLAGEGDVQILSAWRAPDNRVWLELDGRRLDNKESLQPEQHQRLLNLVLDLRPWLEAAQPAAPTPGEVVQPIPQKKAAAAPSAEEAKASPPMESMIEQIDKVLQVKLASSPLRGRGIRLSEGSGGVVLIEDGVNKYEGMEAILDPQVKAIIQQAVADWEKGTR